MGREVWTLADADVSVYQEDSNGNLTDFELVGGLDVPKPIFTYCFLESAEISAGTPTIRRAVTGRGRRKILRPANYFDDVKMTVDNLFLRKSQEIDFTKVFNVTKQLRLALKFDRLTNSGVAPFENDTLTLSFCFATSIVIKGQQADIVNLSATFEAEKLF